MSEHVVPVDRQSSFKPAVRANSFRPAIVFEGKHHRVEIGGQTVY